MSGNITSTSADSVPRVTGGTDSVTEGVMDVPTGRTSADIDIQDSSTTRTASVRNATGAHLRPRRLGRLLEHRRGAADTYATGSVIGSSTRTDRRMAAVRRRVDRRAIRGLRPGPARTGRRTPRGGSAGRCRA